MATRDPIHNDQDFREEVLQRLTALETTLQIERSRAHRAGAMAGSLVAAAIGIIPWVFDKMR